MAERNKREELEKLDEADQKARQTGGPSTTVKINADPVLLPPDKVGTGTTTTDDPKTVKPAITTDAPPVRKPDTKPPVTKPETPEKPAGEKRKGKKGDG